jgi:hypothetical protein
MKRVWIVIGLCLATNAAIAEEEVWFGIPTPEKRQALREEELTSGGLREVVFTPLPLVVPPDQDPYTDIRAEDLIASVTDIVEFSELSRASGEVLWGRIMGSPFTNQAADYMRARFEELGVARVWTEEFSRGPQWLPTHARLTLIGGESFGPGTKDYVFSSAVPGHSSPSVDGESLEAEVVYVGNGRPADLLDRDLAGKIAVMRSRPNPGILNYTGRGIPARLFEAGAVGVVIIFDFPGNYLNLAPYSSESRTSPTFTLGGDDGDFLEEVIAGAGKDNPPRVRMELKLSTQREWLVKNVYGLIPGRSDEYVIAIAHLDAFFDGANDNASGLAALLAWARHFGQREEQPGRNILLVATAGHHSGSPGTERLIGEHRGWLDKTVLLLNCEHLASRAMARYSNFRATIGRRGEPRAARSRAAEGLMPVNTENPRTVSVSTWSPYLVGLMRSAVNRYGLVVSMLTDNRMLGDSYPFGIRARQVPVINFIEGNYWYHTSADTVEALSPQGMERTVRAFAHIIDRVAEASAEDLSRK